MTAYTVPTTPRTPKRITIFLSGTEYTLRFTWNSIASCWILDVSNASGEPLLSGVPIVTGADLLEQFQYVGIYGQMIAQTDNDPGAVPTFDNFGDTSHLFYLSDLAQ